MFPKLSPKAVQPQLSKLVTVFFLVGPSHQIRGRKIYWGWGWGGGGYSESCGLVLRVKLPPSLCLCSPALLESRALGGLLVWALVSSSAFMPQQSSAVPAHIMFLKLLPSLFGIVSSLLTPTLLLHQATQQQLLAYYLPDCCWQGSLELQNQLTDCTVKSGFLKLAFMYGEAETPQVIGL